MKLSKILIILGIISVMMPTIAIFIHILSFEYLNLFDVINYDFGKDILSVSLWFVLLGLLVTCIED